MTMVSREATTVSMYELDVDVARGNSIESTLGARTNLAVLFPRQESLLGKALACGDGA